MTNLPLKNALRQYINSPNITYGVRNQLLTLVNGRPTRETLEDVLNIMQGIENNPPDKPLNLKDFRSKRLTNDQVIEYKDLIRNANDLINENRRQLVRMPKNEAVKAFRRNRPANLIGTAYNGKADDYSIPLLNKEIGVNKIEYTSKKLKPKINYLINDKIKELNSPVRVHLIYKIQYDNIVEHVSLKSSIVNSGLEFENEIEGRIKYLLDQKENENELGITSSQGTHFNNKKLIGVNLIIGKWSPNNGGSYMPLPAHIAAKKACVNPQNKDQECFKWAILASLHVPDKDKERISKYRPYVDQYDWSMLNFPVDPLSIKIIDFEHKNNLSINIYAYDDEEKDVYPKRISKNQGFDCRHVTLLMIEKPEEDTCIDEVKKLFAEYGSKLHRKQLTSCESHYVSIQNMSALLASQYSKHNGKKHFCPVCLHGFTTAELLESHSKRCKPGELLQHVKMPEEGSITKFSNVYKQLRAPYSIYCDAESYLIASGSIETEKRTMQLNQHIAASFHFAIKCSPGWILPEGVSEFSPIFDNPLSFLIELNATCKLLSERVDSVAQSKKNYKPLNISLEEEAAFKSAKHCHICFQKFTGEKRAVRDHCHVTGAFRGAAHWDCNLNLNYKEKHIPCFFHNGRGYDWHLLFKSISEVPEFGDLKIIPRNYEQFISFWGQYIRFLDTTSFYAAGASLENLVENLYKSSGIQAFPTVRASFPNASNDMLSLLMRKGVFPYTWFNGPQRMNELQLPPIEAFFSDLTNTGISKEDYEHAQNVWSAFNCRTFRDYHDIYLRSDVAQLADVFEANRDVSMKGYGLDPAWYFSAPNYFWDAMLKMTKVELELLHDPQMYEFFEQGSRGGISMISHRYAKANNPYLKEYDPTVETSYISYEDSNALYADAMCNKLPINGFKWITKAENITQAEIMKLNPDDEHGMTLEVDLGYPEHLHDLHNDYPLAVEKMRVQSHMISKFNKDLSERFKVIDGCKKLIPNLQNKNNYVVHLSALQFFIKKGLLVKRVHRAISYKQSPWLKTFIDFNTALRAAAKNDVEKDLYKLGNNSVFGKTMESVRTRINLKVRTSEKLFLKDIADPTFMSMKIYSENMVACQKQRSVISLNKPIYVGQAILDLSKVHMYKFWYEYLKPKYGSNIKLLATDTDSLIYHVKTEDLYKDMKKDSHMFDMSEYNPLEEKLGWMYDKTNKKVPGKFKDETQNKPIAEFVGLKPKMYALRLDDNSEKKTCKGIKKNVCVKEINFDHYYKCVMGVEPCQDREQVQIRSVNHSISTLKIKKRALFAYDTKRYILDDGISSLAHGHYAISR